MTGLLLTLFGWPNGIVVGNLLASVIWVPVAWLGMHLLMLYHHSRMDALLERHRSSLADLLAGHDRP